MTNRVEKNIRGRQTTRAMVDEQLLVPAKKAAWRLGISRQSLRRLIKAGDIKAVRVGHMQRPLIPQREIDRIVGGRPQSLITNEKFVGHSKPTQPDTDGPVPERDALTPRERIAAILELAAAS